MRTSQPYLDFGAIQKLMAAVLVMAFLSFSYASQAAPAVSLFTSDTQSTLLETKQAAASMESGIQPALTRLDTQLKELEQEKCHTERAYSTRCIQLKQEINASYKEALVTLRDSLPMLRKSISRTEKSLGKGLRTKVAPMSGIELQTSLQGISKSGSKKKRGGRLSAQLQRYVDVLSSGKSGSNGLVLASELYTDMDVAGESVETLEALIQNQLVSLEVEQLIPGEPAQLETLAAVKGLLFPEEEEIDIIEDLDATEEAEPTIDPWS